MLKHALAFARRSIPVFPLAPRGKVPLTERGFYEASRDPGTVLAWWQRWPDANIGIPTGLPSGIFVVDVDGDAGEASLHDLEASYGSLPSTVEAITGGGGRHLFFRYRAGIGNRVKFVPGLDVRGDGGYVCAPPSIHPSGRSYAWSVDSAPEIAPAPDWLIERISAPRIRIDWNAPLMTVPNGERNSTIARIAGKLLRQPWLERELVLNLCLAFNDARCVPPLSHAEVRRTVENIARREQARHRKHEPS
ncbi:bifunctional DNA primase/polymerase [Roseicella sp. DB1501]|uniref:bifunctional DNA primase/polymerase n=1 Tax=Roseicella sp. DB1501 TaxID=2730925 RepID=UPI001492C9BE|nr:bifunctional DNA primase/polymerase [Roseicella sp. DB1501]NOG73723.1 DNA primase [Roseicella sp. DB1501]